MVYQHTPFIKAQRGIFPPAAFPLVDTISAFEDGPIIVVTVPVYFDFDEAPRNSQSSRVLEIRFRPISAIL